MKLEGSEMNQVECIENAYLVIEDGVIAEFGSMIGLNAEHVSDRGGSGIQNRATPLAAGGGAHDEGVGGVLFDVACPPSEASYMAFS